MAGGGDTMIHTAILACLAAFGIVLLSVIIALICAFPIFCGGYCVLIAEEPSAALSGIRAVRLLRNMGLLQLPICVVDYTANGSLAELYPERSGVTVFSPQEWDEFLMTERKTRANGNGRDPAGNCRCSDLSE